MRVSVIGTGYLGATHAAAMAGLGFEVVGVDVDPAKGAMLSAGPVPFFESGLPDLLQKHRDGRHALHDRRRRGRRGCRHPLRPPTGECLGPGDGFEEPCRVAVVAGDELRLAQYTGGGGVTTVDALRAVLLG